MSFNVDFLGKKLWLSEDCKNVLGATRYMQIYEINLIDIKNVKQTTLNNFL